VARHGNANCAPGLILDRLALRFSFPDDFHFNPGPVLAAFTI
jgi:hypothetical protein